jgi:N-methylhydantoinase A
VTDTRVAADVGGTFIDFVCLDPDGCLTIEKQPARAEALAEEFVAGLSRLPVRPQDIDRLFHGTTVAINAVIQERGAQVGLITTKGFRDVLELGRGNRPEIYNFFYRPPSALIRRRHRREVTGRLDATGTELEPLDLEQLDRETEFLVSEGCEAIAICFLHAYANPCHERVTVERIRERHPSMYTTTSSEIATEWREFERTSSTVLNAYIQPMFAGYLENLQGRLESVGFQRPFALMQSNGGVISSQRAARLPIRTLESGPAGGVIGAHALAADLGYRNVICADVGGTSYDVALIENGEILERTDTTLAGRPVVGSVIDIVSIGAGGGSIAWLDHREALRVGPRSAGASPGPACFGLGGAEPTVTDCHLLLGRLDADRFLGSRMRLDRTAAEDALRSRIAEPAGLSLEAAADGCLQIAETNMTYAIRAVTVERGLDPRDFAMLSYGGGGGLFAAAVAEELEVGTVIIPRAPANFSAWGILTSDYREDVSLTRVRPLDNGTAAQITDDLAELARLASGELRAYGFEGDDIDVVSRLDMRFAGQEHTLTVTLDGATSEERFVDNARSRFVDLHRQIYGHGEIDARIEVVTARVRAIGRVARPRWTALPPRHSEGPLAHRLTYFRTIGEFVEVPVWDREELSPTTTVEGPAIVEEWTTTILIPPSWQAASDTLGNLVLHFVNDNGKTA